MVLHYPSSSSSSSLSSSSWSWLWSWSWSSSPSSSPSSRRNRPRPRPVVIIIIIIIIEWSLNDFWMILFFCKDMLSGSRAQKHILSFACFSPQTNDWIKTLWAAVKPVKCSRCRCLPNEMPMHRQRCPLELRKCNRNHHKKITSND